MTIAPARQGQAPSTRLRPEATDATRYLCAAPYLDEAFARAVLDEVLHQPHRAIAPSHGISLGPVIRHCMAARRQSLVRDGLVATTLILGLVASFTAGFIIVLTLVITWLIVRALHLSAAQRAAVSLALLVIALIFILIPAGLFAISPLLYGFGSYFGFPGGGFAPGREFLWVLLLVVIWGIYFGYRLVVHRTISFELTPERYDPRRAPALDRKHEARLAYVDAAQQGNVTVYAQETGSRPFIGLGRVTQEWSLVTPLSSSGSPQWHLYSPAERGRRTVSSTEADAADGQAVPFTIDELYAAIRMGMAGLADPQLPQDETVPHLSVRDRVFLAGKLPIDSPFLEHGMPRYRLSEAEVKNVQRMERGRLRHYLSVRMAGWAGELEVTTFMHAAQRGRMLFVEFIATVVPGISSAYHRIDTYDRLDATSIMRAAARALGDVIQSPLALATVPAAGWAKIRRALRESSNAKQISRQLMFDYGCRSSVRELGADFFNGMLFQLYDANERISVVERRLLQVLVSFLGEHHYDITDLAGQAATVINNSTQINSNSFYKSTLNSSPVAAGTGATGNVNTVPKSASSSPAAGRSASGGQT